MTGEILYEVAANSIVLTVSGGHLEGVGSADGLYPNCTGLEARLMGQIGHTIAKNSVTLEEANKLVLQLLDRYEHVFSIPDGNPGVRFDRAYDLETLSPVPEWEKIYNEILDELQGLGLSL
jgi:methylamine--corrinoid protein Co-methyltransferase